MDIEELKKLALDEGFSASGELNMDALVFMPEVRDMCRADRCHAYGTNWMCPPGVGTIEESFEKASKYKSGVLVLTIGQMDDEFDYDTIKATSEKHQKNFVSLMKKVRAKFGDVLGMGAGACTICKKCTYPDAPCRFPDDAYSSMEGYGLWVSKVCELSDMKYYNGKNTITYISCVLLKE